MNFSPDEIHVAASIARPFLNTILAEKEGEYAKVLKSRDEVILRYQHIFAPENIANLTAEQYRSFLVYSNNKHWKSLQRMGPAHTANMDLLRKALAILVDENRSINERLNILLSSAGPMIPRLGAATLTPILMIVYPEKYSVLNNPVEAALRKINLWPSFPRDISFSEKYSQVNQISLALANELSIDLWTLDTLWWAILLERGANPDTEAEPISDEANFEITTADFGELPRFGLERYLQEFMRDNWEKIHEFDEWQLYEQDGDLVGFEYNTNEVGRIDLLACHKKKPQWLVIELKRNQGSDQTIGQVLRYMGWVEKNLVKEASEQVYGLVICNSIDPSIQYALKHTRNVNVLLYEVQFQLHKP